MNIEIGRSGVRVNGIYTPYFLQYQSSKYFEPSVGKHFSTPDYKGWIVSKVEEITDGKNKCIRFEATSGIASWNDKRVFYTLNNEE